VVDRLPDFDPGKIALALLPLRHTRDRQIDLFRLMGMGGIDDARRQKQNAASDAFRGDRAAQTDKLAPPIAVEEGRAKIRSAVSLLSAQIARRTPDGPDHTLRAHRLQPTTNRQRGGRHETMRRYVRPFRQKRLSLCHSAKRRPHPAQNLVDHRFPPQPSCRVLTLDP
jgi:hypothetical protein